MVTLHFSPVGQFAHLATQAQIRSRRRSAKRRISHPTTRAIAAGIAQVHQAVAFARIGPARSVINPRSCLPIFNMSARCAEPTVVSLWVRMNSRSHECAPSVKKPTLRTKVWHWNWRAKAGNRSASGFSFVAILRYHLLCFKHFGWLGLTILLLQTPEHLKTIGFALFTHPGGPPSSTVIPPAEERRSAIHVSIRVVAWLWWRSWAARDQLFGGQTPAPGTGQRDIGLSQVVDAKPDPMAIRKHSDRPPTRDIECSQRISSRRPLRKCTVNI